MEASPKTEELETLISKDDEDTVQKETLRLKELSRERYHLEEELRLLKASYQKEALRLEELRQQEALRLEALRQEEVLRLEELCEKVLHKENELDALETSLEEEALRLVALRDETVRQEEELLQLKASSQKQNESGSAMSLVNPINSEEEYPVFKASFYHENIDNRREEVILVPPAKTAPVENTDHAANLCDDIRYLYDRCRGLLDIPLVLVFGIILYVVDVGSDIMAAVDHFQEGHPVWGSLTITFVILPAFCWAAVSWTFWNTTEDVTTKRRRRRRRRRLLAVLLLDPLVR